MDSFSFHRDLLRVNISETVNITKITFTDCFMDNIPKELTMAFPKVELLDVSRTHLERLENYDFSDTNSVVTLNASNNKIYKLGSRMVSSLSDLETLDISHNLVERLNPTAFVFSNKFKYLNLSHNRISSLEKAFLEPLRSLEVLKLDHNLITEISPWETYRVLQWKELYLQNNKLIALHPSLVKTVEILDVSLNSLETANFKDSKLREFLISDNELKTLTISKAVAKLDASGNKKNSMLISWEGCTSIKHLDLAETKLANIEQTLDYLKNFKDLEYLDLMESRVVFSQNIFQGLEKLQTLLLSGAIIGLLPDKTFVDLKSLTTLDLSGNILQFLNLAELKNSRNLETLKLRNSNIYHIYGWENITLSLPKLKEIDIYDNKFNCKELPIVIKDFRKANILVVDWDDKGTEEFLRDSCIDEKAHREDFPSHYKDDGMHFAWYFIGFVLLCLVVAGIVFAFNRFDLKSNIPSFTRSSNTRFRTSHLLQDDM